MLRRWWRRVRAIRVDPVTGLSSLGVVAVSAADGILSDAVDPSGSPLTVTAVSGANGSGAASQTIAGAYGLLIVQPDGSYRYLLENASGPTGSPLQDVFTVAVSDGNGGTTTAQVDVTVDRPPVARDDIAVDIDPTGRSTISATAAKGVLANDTSPDGDQLSVIAVSGAGGVVAPFHAVEGAYGTLALGPPTAPIPTRPRVPVQPGGTMSSPMW
jgi:VCBS repeat-containing protein